MILPSFSELDFHGKVGDLRYMRFVFLHEMMHLKIHNYHPIDKIVFHH